MKPLEEICLKLQDGKIDSMTLKKRKGEYGHGYAYHLQLIKQCSGFRRTEDYFFVDVDDLRMYFDNLFYMGSQERTDKYANRNEKKTNGL